MEASRGSGFFSHTYFLSHFGTFLGQKWGPGRSCSQQPALRGPLRIFFLAPVIMKFCWPSRLASIADRSSPGHVGFLCGGVVPALVAVEQ